MSSRIHLRPSSDRDESHDPFGPFPIDSSHAASSDLNSTFKRPTSTPTIPRSEKFTQMQSQCLHFFGRTLVPIVTFDFVTRRASDNLLQSLFIGAAAGFGLGVIGNAIARKRVLKVS